MRPIRAQTQKMSIEKNKLAVDISRNVERMEGEPDDEAILQTLISVIEHFKDEPAEISLRVVNKKEMQELNKKFRKKNDPTNVLAFPSEILLEEVPLLGDIVICNGVVEDEAKDYEMSYSDRYKQMLVHATLHLLGFDHQKEKDRIEMEKFEKKFASSVGIESPYD